MTTAVPDAPLFAAYGTVAATLADLDPVPALKARLSAELAATFDPARPIRISRAPGRLDVMGGIAAYAGSSVLQATVGRAAAIALQARDDRQVQVFSFNLLDDHKPFTFNVSLDVLAGPVANLKAGFAAPGRQWAAHLAGCLAVLHQAHLVDLSNPQLRGVNLALLNTVPPGAGLGSSAAITVATMVNLLAHLERINDVDPIRLSTLCQRVQEEFGGTRREVVDQFTCCYGQTGTLVRMVCQPHTMQPALPLPTGVRVVGINGGAGHDAGGGQFAQTRCAASMGHAIILDRIKQMGLAHGRELVADPMHGYLANLDPDDYKNLFRPHVPEAITGRAFLDRCGPTIDSAVDPDVSYAVQHATDHHVLEARRVRRFAEFLGRVDTLTGPRRKLALDQAGHLMYASHLSYTMDALLGTDGCDLVVKLVRERERAGLYGARITAGGGGGTVAVLCDESPAADDALAEIIAVYERETGRAADVIPGTSPGAWHTGILISTK